MAESVVVHITQKRTTHRYSLKPYFQTSKKEVHTGIKRDDICQRVDIVTA